MNYISHKIRKIFDLDWFVSVQKLDFDIGKVVPLLAAMVVSYIVLIPIYNLIKNMLVRTNVKSVANSESLTRRKYKNIKSNFCSGCASDSSPSSSSSSNSSYGQSPTLNASKFHKAKKSKHVGSKKVNKVNKLLRKFKITE